MQILCPPPCPPTPPKLLNQTLWRWAPAPFAEARHDSETQEVQEPPGYRVLGHPAGFVELISTVSQPGEEQGPWRAPTSLVCGGDPTALVARKCHRVNSLRKSSRQPKPEFSCAKAEHKMCQAPGRSPPKDTPVPQSLPCSYSLGGSISQQAARI